MWNRKCYIIYDLFRLKLSLCGLNESAIPPRHWSVSSFYIFPFDVNTKSEAEGCTDYCLRPSCIQTTDAIWVRFWNVVKSIHSLLGAQGSVSRQNTGFPFHSGRAGVACGWILGEWGSYLSQRSLSQVSQHSTGPILSATREELTQRECGMEKMA